jgi:very-short-patch-repair endonuclease
VSRGGQLSDELQEGLLRVWQHHRARRQRGLPTVTLAVADPPVLPFPLETILEGAGATLAFSSGTELRLIVRDWLSTLEERHDLEAEALAWLGLELGASHAEVRVSWSARTGMERMSWLESLERAHPQPLAALEVLRAACARSDSEGLEPAQPHGQDPRATLSSLRSWLPGGDRLVFCLESARTATLRALLALAELSPSWPLLAVVEPDEWRAAQDALDDRSRTLLEQGRLPSQLSPLVKPSPRTGGRGDAAGDSSGEERAGSTLANEAKTAMRLARAAVERGDGHAETLAGRARSLAERRLYELLQAEQVTRGLFALNELQPFMFGPRRAEIDLVCAELRIAVEVDGYHHFREFDGYRRDRRKDVLLQHQGYLVSRHLAADVTECPGAVVRSIRELVLRRRRTRQRKD